MTNSFTVNTYSPKDVILTIGGYQMTGWDTIVVNRSVKGFSVVRGIRGKNTRVRNTDSSATIGISLLQSSQGNDVMSDIHQQDLVNGTGRLALTLKDNSGRSVFSSNEAFIVGFPASRFSGQFEYRDWEIFAQSTDTFTIGGNARPSSIFDTILDEATDFVNNIF